MNKQEFKQKPIREVEPLFGSYKELENRPDLRIEPCFYFGLCSLKTRRIREIPPAWIATLRNARVHQPNFAVTSGEFLWQFDKETKLPYFSAGYSDAFDLNKNGTLSIRNLNKSVKKIERAILLGGRVSYSYFHQAFEYITKLEILDRFPEFADWPLLADARLDSQARDMLRAAAGGSREIIWSEAGLDNIVTELVAIASPTYLPDDPALDLDAAAIDSKAVEWLSRKFRDGENASCDASLIWITRRNYATQARSSGYYVRDIYNSIEIEDFFNSIGGHICSPESLTFDQQRTAFAGADIVCMAAGSAVTNLIFCRPGTKIMIISQNNHVNPGLLIGIAQACQLELCWVFGLGVPSDRPPAHWSYIVDPLNVQRGIDYLTGKNICPDGSIAFS
ncbi:glycosyltransferase family 61 protein [Methylobacterium sp. D48H]